MVDFDGVVWTLQLAVFVFVSLNAGGRIVDGSLALDTLAGVGNVVLFLLAVTGAVVVAVTREPLSGLVRRSDDEYREP